MAIKDGNTASANEVIESIGRLSSQNTNRILKSDTSVFVNEQYSGADDFTDANGVMNTVDTGNSSSSYDTSNEYYVLKLSDEASGDTTHDPDSMTNPENAFDDNDSTSATYTQSAGNSDTRLGKTFASKTIRIIRTKSSGSIKVGAPGSGTINWNWALKLQKFNGATWDDISTLDTGSGSSGIPGGGGVNTVDSFSITNNNIEEITIEGVRLELIVSVAGVASNYSATTVAIQSIEYGNFDSSSTVETNSIISDIVPDSIVVYGEKDIPTDTSITVDVSDDGGSTFSLTGKELDTAIDTSSFTVGNLALKFNLATTDTSVTPKIFGYGISITDT